MHTVTQARARLGCCTRGSAVGWKLWKATLTQISCGRTGRVACRPKRELLITFLDRGGERDEDRLPHKPGLNGAAAQTRLVAAPAQRRTDFLHGVLHENALLLTKSAGPPRPNVSCGSGMNKHTPVPARLYFLSLPRICSNWLRCLSLKRAV